MSESQRFVILMHDHPVLHWDLMIEVGDVLRTWRLERAPHAGADVPAVALADHRRMYLDYEGPVSGDRGTVVHWDAGTYSELDVTLDVITAMVHGERMTGMISLVRTQDGDEWSFVFHPASEEGL